MSRDPRVMVLGLDVGKLGGVFRATSGLLEKHGAARVVDTPLAEASIIGASLGLGISGMVPVAEIQFLGFTAQAFHQIGPQRARYRARSRGRYHCQVTIRAPFGGGIHSPEFHSDAVEAQFVQSPGIKVVCPSNPYDAKGLLIEAIRDPDPVLFLEPQRLYRIERVEVPDDDYQIPFGQARLAREGKDVVLVAWSAAVELSLKAAEQLRRGRIRPPASAPGTWPRARWSREFLSRSQLPTAQPWRCPTVCAPPGTAGRARSDPPSPLSQLLGCRGTHSGCRSCCAS